MIYMSGDLVDKLSDPSFITFIRQQKKFYLHRRGLRRAIVKPQRRQPHECRTSQHTEY